MAIDSNKRAAGVLLPVFSLPSPYGIGCFSEEAYHFIDRLSEAGQTYWQILPIGPAGGSDSPYQPHSCFAGEPMYIDPEALARQGLLTDDDLDQAASPDYDLSSVDYRRVRPIRNWLLRTAYERFCAEPEDSELLLAFREFCESQESWLSDYVLFEALTAQFGTNFWNEWPEDIRDRKPASLRHWKQELSEETRYQSWLQFEFFREWKQLKEYAHSKGIRIIGDIPIYAALESVDVWVNRKVFQLGEDCKPSRVSGAPPDPFSPKGQVWGNPLYDWNYLKRTGYRWWIERLRHMFRLYDVVRLDHTRGLESYFSIPAGADDAALGHWEKGPGLSFFRAVSKKLNDPDLIAEDLGDITPEVVEMVHRAGLPGMKVLQFAFDGDPKNPYLPENFGKDSVVYTGTHDNNTTIGWYEDLPASTRCQITAYLRQQNGIHESAKAPIFGSHSATSLLVELAHRSDAAICIIQMQDHLLLDASARVNVPGTIWNNWQWRMHPDAFTRTRASHMASLARRSGR